MKRREFFKRLGIMVALSPIWNLCLAASAEASRRIGRYEYTPAIPKKGQLVFGKLERRRKTDQIVIHHIGSTDQDVSAATVHSWHLQNGWSGIGYHYLIRKSGAVEVGRPLDMVGAHCYGENKHTVGVNIVGNFEIGMPTDGQIEAAAALLADLCRRYRIKPNEKTIVGHRDLSATACPGRNLYARLPELIVKTQAIYKGR